MLNIKEVTETTSDQTVFIVSHDNQEYALTFAGDDIKMADGKDKDKLLGRVCGFSSSSQIAQEQKENLSKLSKAIITARIRAKQPVLGMKIR